MHHKLNHLVHNPKTNNKIQNQKTKITRHKLKSILNIENDVSLLVVKLSILVDSFRYSTVVKNRSGSYPKGCFDLVTANLRIALYFNFPDIRFSLHDALPI